MNQGQIWISKPTWNFSIFRLALESKAGEIIPESSNLEFLEKISAINFASSDEENNFSKPLSRESIPDLPLFRILLV